MQRGEEFCNNGIIFPKRRISIVTHEPTNDQPSPPQVTRRIKADILAFFSKYKSERESLTSFFRNGELTAAKIRLVNEITKHIKQFGGTVHELWEYLDNQWNENKIISNEAGKFHKNLLQEEKVRKNGWEDSDDEPNATASTYSNLATALALAKQHLVSIDPSCLAPSPTPSAPPVTRGLP
jgi:hypothetical protein